MGNHAGIASNRYRRAWPFPGRDAAVLHVVAPNRRRAGFLRFFSIVESLAGETKISRLQRVVQPIIGYATEPFDWADQNGALKVVDCPNSHPVTHYGFWQRECDLWCPGDTVPIPHWMFARMTRELERADLIIVQSQFCKESMMLNGIPASEKIIVNLMGVNTDVCFQNERRLQARFVSHVLARFTLRKGHQYLFLRVGNCETSAPRCRTDMRRPLQE